MCKICSNCGHGTIPRWCRICDGSLLCQSCRYHKVQKKGAKCATCAKPIWKGKRKERKVGEQLTKWAAEGIIPAFTSSDKALPGADGPKYRMDFYYDRGSFFVGVECDEREHALRGYPPRCELVRMYNITRSRGLPAVFIRFNPDSFRIAGKRERVDKARRYELLQKTLGGCLKDGPGSSFMLVIMICYSQPVGKMHGEKLAYVTTQYFQTELDYETYVGNVYPNNCSSAPSKVDWFVRD